jgi:tetratricopeptide (TPR) repeat protein
MKPYRERVSAYLTNYGTTLAEKTEVRKQLNRYYDATQKLIDGQIAYAKGQYERAVGLFNQAATLNPDDNTIRYNLGVASGLIREGEQDELKQLEQAVKGALAKDPKDPQGYVQLAVIYEGQGKLAEAAEAFETALKYAPTRPDLYVLLGPIYERQERYDDALRTYQRLEALDPNLPAPVFAVMASLYFHKNMLPNALEYTQKSLKSDPNSWRAHYLLGRIHAEQNDVRKAIDSYQNAIRLAPNEPFPHSSLADVYFAQKQYNEALKSINEALRIAPNEPMLLEQRRQIQDAM